MEKYFRKVVQIRTIQNDRSISDKVATSYYKLEKRSDRYKVTLAVEGIPSYATNSFAFCPVMKREGIYWVKEVRTLLVKDNKINETIQLDEADAVPMVGMIIVAKDHQRPINYVKDTLFIGYQEEEFKLEDLELQNDLDLNRKKEIFEEEILTEEIISNKETKQVDHTIQEVTTPDKEIVLDKENSDHNTSECKEEMDAVHKKDVEEKDGNQRVEEHTKEAKKEKNHVIERLDSIKKNMEKSEIEEFLDDIFKTNQKMNPFENEDINTEWVKIEITDLVFLPIESWMYINNAFLMNCYRKYKHLILGRKKGESHIKLGVPDIYFFKSSIVANLCGFYEFTSCKNALPKAGEYGYWLVKSIV